MIIRHLIVSVVLLGGAFALSGCGGGGDLPVRNGPQELHPVYGEKW